MKIIIDNTRLRVQSFAGDNAVIVTEKKTGATLPLLNDEARAFIARLEMDRQTVNDK